MKRLTLASWALSVVLILSASLKAQVDTGTILGVVTDPAGAVVAGAKVTATNEDTNFSRSTESAGDGSYIIPLLPISQHYRVTVSGAGFQTYEQTGIQVDVRQNARVDAHLQLGQVTQKVEVTAQAPLVDTHSATGGEVVGTERLVDLPLNGRNPLQLAGLLPGVSDLVTIPVLNAGNRAANFMSIDGSRLNEVDYQLDGIRYAGSYNNSGLDYPDPDALAEFRLVTNPNSAEYGQYAGGVMLGVMKSGSNSFHGDIYDFLRNDALNARNFFSSGVPVLRQNQFGGVAGGRLIKNKLFWFGAYQGFRIRQQSLASSTPLTAAERAGLITSSKPIINPLTGQPFSQNAAGQYVIPTTQFSPVSQYVLNNFVPLPPASGVYQALGSVPQNVDQYSGKVDYHISEKNQIYASGIDDLTSYSNPFEMGSFPTYGNVAQTQKVHLLAVSDIHTFRPNLINEARFGWAGQHEQYKGSGQISPQTMGIQNWNYNYLTDAQPQSPTFGITGRFTLGSSGLGKWREGGEYFDIVDILNWVKGNHNIKMGVELYHRQHALDANIDDTGSFAFNGTVSGNAAADFLLGELGDVVRVRYLNHPGYKAWTDAGFVQDDWKIRRRLTLNLGLRYELYFPFTEYRAENEGPDMWEQHGHLSVPGEAQIEPGVQSTVFPYAPVGLVYPGDKTPLYPNGVPVGIIPLDKLQLQPRAGLAWDPFGDGKTSVRASAGLFSNAQYVDMQAQNSQDLPWVVVQVSVLPPGNLSNPYAGLLQFPPPTSANLTSNPNLFTPFEPGTGYGWGQGYVMPRITSLAFNVQRQITNNFMLEVGYDGKLSRHLQVGRNINTAPYGPGATLANEQSRRPINPAGFQAIYMQESIGTASYNSLQVVARYRVSDRLNVLGSYTWAHSLDFCSQYAAGGSCFNNPLDMATNKGSSDFDQTDHFALSLVYALPDPFHRQNSRVLTSVFGGWEFSGIVTANTGLPYTVVTGVDDSLTGAGADHPNLVGNPNFSGQSRALEVSQYINKYAFVQNGPGTFGTVGRNSFTAPALFNSDLALMKNFRLGEQRRLQFRSEFFNAFNQTHLSAPTATYVSPIFGQITSAGSPRLIQFSLKFYW